MSHARTQQMRMLRPLVMSRANGQCEAERCPYPAEELQHVLPRSAASHGDEHLLDRWAVAEIKRGWYPDLPWLMALCKRCHDLAHGNPKWAYSVGLLMRGEVRTGLDGRPVYRGPAGVLQALFPEVAA